MQQQPQDNPIIIIADDDTSLLEAEREKNRILRVAIANNGELNNKYRKRSRELSRLQASIDNTIK